MCMLKIEFIMFLSLLSNQIRAQPLIMSYLNHDDQLSYPKKWAPAGPTSTSLLTSPSPSTMGGGYGRHWRFDKRHVTRVGAGQFLGGMIMRMPLWRLPLIDPPLASTMKLTRNLPRTNKGREIRVREKGKAGRHNTHRIAMKSQHASVMLWLLLSSVVSLCVTS